MASEGKEQPEEGGEARETFSVASWNVLASCYASPSYFPASPPSALSWEARLPQVVRRLSLLEADVYALQEVDDFPAFQAHFTREGFECAFVRRPAGKADGCLTAWRSSLFELSPSRPPEAVSFDDLAECAAGRTAQARLRRHNEALIVTLRLRRPRGAGPGQAAPDPPRELVVSNAHLYWSPQHDDVKLAQAVYLARRVEHAAACVARRAGGARPAVVLAGDLNSTPGSPAERFLLGRPAHARTAPLEYSGDRLLLDAGLRKVARWLRAIGVDAAYAGDQARGEQVLRQAAAERRLVVTPSARLVSRRACPPYHLVGAKSTPERVFEELIAFYGYSFDPATFYSRCTLCNSLVRRIDLARVAELPEGRVPGPLRGGKTESGIDIRFFECAGEDASCGQVYWWATPPEESERRYRVIIQRTRVRQGVRRALLRDLRQRHHLQVAAAAAAAAGRDEAAASPASRDDEAAAAASLMPEESLVGAATAAALAGARVDLSRLDELLPPMPAALARPSERVRVCMHSPDDLHPIDLLEAGRDTAADAAELEKELGRVARKLLRDEAARKEAAAAAATEGAAGLPPRDHSSPQAHLSLSLLTEASRRRAALPAAPVPPALLDDLTDFGVFSLSLRHGLGLRTAYDDPPPETTNLTDKFTGCLDYVMFGSPALRCVGTRPLPSERDVLGGWGGPLPNEQWPSDHLALRARLAWE